MHFDIVWCLSCDQVAETSELFVGDVGDALTFFGDDAVVGLVKDVFADRNGGDLRALGNNLIGFQWLRAFEEFLGDGCVALNVEHEEVFRGLLADNTTALLLVSS